MRNEQKGFRQMPLYRWLEAFYHEHREVLLYLFFGGLTTVVSVVSYSVLNVGFGINELVANVFSWILAVSFAFFTNRIWVFSAPTKTWKEFGKQMVSFFGGRVATLLVEELILAVFVTLLAFPSVGVKIAAQFVVIVLNYVVSKCFVFRKPKG